MIEKLEYTESEAVTSTYGMDFERHIISGRIDGIDALRQAVKKILLTEAEDYPVYSPRYGLMRCDLYGASSPYVEAMLQARIKTAILSDDRFKYVDFADTKWTDHGSLSMTVKITTADGVTFTEEADLNV